MNVLRLARTLNIGAFLPEAMARELETHWLRQGRELLGKVSTHLREVVDASRYSFPNLDALRVDYRAKVDAARAQYNLQFIPLPRRALGEVFERWVAGSAVEGKVAHLKDTAIYQSIVEHLEREPGHVGVFVSKDSHFDEEFMRRLTPPEVRVELSPGLTPLLEVLRRGLNAELRRQLDEDRRRAQVALEARRDDLERFINATSEVPDKYLPYPRIVAFRGARVMGIRGVLTTHLEEEQPSGRVGLSAQVEVELRLLVEGQFPSPPERAIKIGEQPLAPEYFDFIATSLAGGSIIPPPQERFEKAVVIVEATAVLRDEDYEDVQFVSASLVPRLFANLFERTRNTTT